MKVFVYLILLIAPLSFMHKAEHYSKLYKNILVAIVVWFFQINVMSYEMKFDLFNLGFTPQNMGLMFMPLLLNIIFMTKTWSVPPKVD